MFAKRDIKKGEELFFNYHITKESFNDFKWARSGENAKLKVEHNNISNKFDKLKSIEEKYLESDDNKESGSQFVNKELKYKRRKKNSSKNKVQKFEENETTLLNKRKNKLNYNIEIQSELESNRIFNSENESLNISDQNGSNFYDNSAEQSLFKNDFKINFKHVKLSKYYKNN